VRAEFPTIQAAINAAVDGDAVLVNNGVYIGGGNWDLDTLGKAIEIRSSDGPATTIISGDGWKRIFSVRSGEGPDTIIRGFKVFFGYGYSSYEIPGGGISCVGTSPTIQDCIVTHCVSDSSSPGGAGIGCSGGSPTIIGCLISDNSAGYGGGLGFESSNAVVQNCLITRNVASSDGSAVACRESNVSFINCTIVDNTASGSGWLRADYGASISMMNCIVWSNTPQTIVGNPAQLMMSFSNIEGGWPGVGNIDLAPLFVDPDGPDNNPASWGDNNYRLAAGSPCIDAGDNAAVLAGVFTDLDGRPRFFRRSSHSRHGPGRAAGCGHGRIRVPRAAHCDRLAKRPHARGARGTGDRS